METARAAAGMADEGQAGRTLRDYARLRAQVADCLDELARINEETGQPARATRVREVREGLLAQRFTLLMLGEFKRGKSTLINRLLGVDALPVGAAPTTAVLTRVTYGDEPAAQLVLQDGTVRSVDPDRLGDEITLVQTEEGTNQQRHAGVVRAEVRLPSPLCRDGVDVVDSPGLGEHRTRTEVTYDALPSADAVIFVSDAAQLGNEDEGFVRARLATEDIDNVFYVINKWDRIYNEAEDPEAEIAALSRRAWALFVPEPKVGYNGQDLRAHRIYPLSCRPNLAPAEVRPQLVAGFEAFRGDLEAFVVRERGRIAQERALARARGQIAETQAGLRARGPALEAGLAEFERRATEAEAELRKIEAPRQAIREAIAACRQEVRKEVRTRAERDLPAIEARIKEEFEAYEYRPRQQLGQRILDGMQDNFRRQKIREELWTKGREIAAAQLEPWATGLSSYVEGQVTTLLKGIEDQVGAIEASFQQATRIIGGLDGNADAAAKDQEDLIRRGLAAGIGVLLVNPFLIMAGSMHGFKGVGRTLLYQFGGALVLSMLGLPILPALIVGATIATVQGNDELIGVLKEQVLTVLLDQLRAMRTTGLGELEAQALVPVEACGVAVERAIEGRIADHRETVAALRAQVGNVREAHGAEQARLAEAQIALTALAARLETLDVATISG